MEEGLRVGKGWQGGCFDPHSLPHKNRYVFAYFYAYAQYKISSSKLKWFSSFNTNKKSKKRSNRQIRDKRGVTPPMVYEKQSKVILT